MSDEKENEFKERQGGLVRSALADARDCPFCGGEPSMAHKNYESSEVKAFCESCGAVGPGAHTYDNAVFLWNRRANDVC